MIFTEDAGECQTGAEKWPISRGSTGEPKPKMISLGSFGSLYLSVASSSIAIN